MKVAITARENNSSGPIDLRFGRAKWIILYDTQNGEYQVHDNNVNLNAHQGAGIQTGRNIAQLNAEAVITGNVGPNAVKTLKAADVKVFLSPDQTVAQAVDSFMAGKLEEVTRANVEGHWV